MVQQALPDAIIVGDQTEPVYAGNQFFRPAQPRSWFNSSTGYGTLGYALPAAIGAKLAAPDRPVVALVGDGGLQFTLPELASAVEAEAPVIVLVWNNQAYGEIKTYMVEQGIAADRRRPLHARPRRHRARLWLRRRARARPRASGRAARPTARDRADAQPDRGHRAARPSSCAERSRASPWQGAQPGYNDGRASSGRARSWLGPCHTDVAAGRGSPTTARRARAPIREGDRTMAFKPNYNQQRSERNRIKEAKKQEKLQKREEEVAKRKAARDAQPADDAAPETE